jgi:hypothetical protein
MNDIDKEFREYIERRTKYAVEVARRTNLIDLDYAGIALLQALWAREFWFNKCMEK